MEAAGHVYVGTIQVKKLQALCTGFNHDHQRCGQNIDHSHWDEEVVQAMIEMMHIERDKTLAMFQLRTWTSLTLMTLRLMRWHL
jgi:hypothetical protein